MRVETQLLVRITPELKRALVRIKKATGITLQDLTRQALERVVAEAKAPPGH